MALRPADFESAAYTSSATWAFAARPRCRTPAKTALSRKESGYADFLRARGCESADPWNDLVISAVDRGRIVSGRHLRNAHLPARAQERHSETAYTTDLALDWIRARGDTPWVSAALG